MAKKRVRGTDINTVSAMKKAKWYLRQYKLVKGNHTSITDKQIIHSSIITGSFEKEAGVEFLQWYQGGVRIGLAGTDTMHFESYEQQYYKRLDDKLYVLQAEIDE